MCGSESARAGRADTLPARSPPAVSAESFSRNTRRESESILCIYPVRTLFAWRSIPFCSGRSNAHPIHLGCDFEAARESEAKILSGPSLLDARQEGE